MQPHDRYQPDLFKETMILIPRGTTFKNAWEGYSLEAAYERSSLTKEQPEEIYEILKLPARPPQVPRTGRNYWPIAQQNWIEKKNDPGKFSISCTILNNKITDCLCDTGSWISIIPKVAAGRIGITLYQRSDISLSTAKTSAIPVLGEIPDLPVRIGVHIVRTAFHVIDTQGERNTSIMLGRPFLATVGAVIDLPRKRVTFTHIGTFCIYQAVPT